MLFDITKPDSFAAITAPLINLYKNPFNAGKVDVNVKSDTFSLNNCFKDGTVFTNSQLTGSDAFCGLAKGCTLPITKTFDGKDIKVTVSKEIKSLKIQCEGSYTPSTGGFGDNIKAEYCGKLASAGVSLDVKNIAATNVHAVAGYKGVTVGVQGAANNLHGLNYIISPTKDLTLQTDLTKFNIGYLLATKEHQVGLAYSWTKASADHAFAFAAKKQIGIGMVHIKTDLTGQVDLAHVSHVDFGEFKNVKCTLGGQFNALSWNAPKFGCGLDFSF